MISITPPVLELSEKTMGRNNNEPVIKLFVFSIVVEAPKLLRRCSEYRPLSTLRTGPKAAAIRRLNSY